ncbi:IS66 family transposase [Pseudomonas syringae]|nr:IS66 family transposase [Pseudomonas syringae]QVI78053.1 IS66 family transposase [Pseudomonas syringae]
MDMRAGTETALAKVIAVFGAAQPHCAYLFANRRANRMKVLVHDGFGIWLVARRFWRLDHTALAVAVSPSTYRVTEIGCMAHARRKFFELHATNKSMLAEQALRYIQLLYEIEREVRDLEPDLRRRIRQEKAVPVMNMLHAWMIAQRDLVPEGSAISRTLDYSLRRWAALSRYLDDGAVPIDNNWAENQIRPWALGRKNWLFAGSLRSGQRAAATMSLIQSARLNGHDPYAYLKDVLTRLPTQRASGIDQLLPHKWQPA